MAPILNVGSSVSHLFVSFNGGWFVLEGLEEPEVMRRPVVTVKTNALTGGLKR